MSQHSKLPEPLRWLDDKSLENMCHSCGLCCRAKIKIDKSINVLVPDLYCKYLEKGDEPGTTCCSVYEDRHEVAKGWCLPLAEAIEKGVFPDLCPYVQEVKGYVGAKILPDEEYNMLKPLIKKAVSSGGKPNWLSDEAWKNFMEYDDEGEERGGSE